MRFHNSYTLFPRVLPSGLKVFYYYAYSPDGMRQTARSTGCLTITDARHHCQRLLNEGTLLQESTPKKVHTFHSFAENFWVLGKSLYLKYREQRGFGVSLSYAVNQNKQLNKYLLPAWGKKVLDQITAPMVENWFMSLKDEGLAHQTCNHLLSNLRTILSEAQRLGHIPNNPAEAIKPLAKIAKARGILTVDEVKELLDGQSWSLYWPTIHLYLANLLSAATGMRMGEIQALRKCDFYPENKPDRIIVSHSWDRSFGLKGTKTWKSRVIPLSPLLRRKLFLVMVKLGPEDFLFPNPSLDKPIYERNLTDSLYTALEKLGIGEAERKERNITFHSWRHFFNTFLRKQGIQDSKVQMVTGHSSVEMTDHYTHFDVTDLKEVEEAQVVLLTQGEKSEEDQQVIVDLGTKIGVAKGKGKG